MLDPIGETLAMLALAAELTDLDLEPPDDDNLAYREAWFMRQLPVWCAECREAVYSGNGCCPQCGSELDYAGEGYDFFNGP